VAAGADNYPFLSVRQIRLHPGKLLLKLVSKEGVTMREWLSAIGNVCRELAYGFDAGNAIQHGLPTPPAPKASPSRAIRASKRSLAKNRCNAQQQYEGAMQWQELGSRPFVPDDLSDAQLN